MHPWEVRSCSQGSTVHVCQNAFQMNLEGNGEGEVPWWAFSYLLHVLLFNNSYCTHIRTCILTVLPMYMFMYMHKINMYICTYTCVHTYVRMYYSEIMERNLPYNKIDV